ncbi:hypothetical protein GALL_430550 [mine drainage metagenome]|uniref:Uncharacterized protein n=1 Tax=mine drainage metagenome TaxID=410659 RepID=A0A1J5PUZ4_9ZZZZ
MRQFVAAAKRAQHIGWLQAGRRAGRSARHRNPLDRHDQRLALDVVEADVEVVRHASLQIAVDVNLFDIFQAIEQAMLQHARTFDVGAHFELGDAEGLAHADDLVCGQRA